MDDEIQLQAWQVTKGLFELVQRQQTLIVGLYESHNGLIAALAKEFGWESPPLLPEPTAAEIERANQGLSELEKMFRDKDGSDAAV